MQVDLSLSCKVYPRVCGGTIELPPTYKTDKGLSPRVRGNRAWLARRRRHDRSIPACAGEPRDRDLRIQAAQVYPRVCGGTALGLHVDAGMTGLSPRVRGNLEIVISAFRLHRSIPACAGEPRAVLVRLRR